MASKGDSMKIKLLIAITALIPGFAFAQTNVPPSNVGAPKAVDISGSINTAVTNTNKTTLTDSGNASGNTSLEGSYGNTNIQGSYGNTNIQGAYGNTSVANSGNTTVSGNGNGSNNGNTTNIVVVAPPPKDPAIVVVAPPPKDPSQKKVEQTQVGNTLTNKK